MVIAYEACCLHSVFNYNLSEHIFRIRAAVNYIRSFQLEPKSPGLVWKKIKRIKSKNFLCLDARTRWKKAALLLNRWR